MLSLHETVCNHSDLFLNTQKKTEMLNNQYTVQHTVRGSASVRSLLAHLYSLTTSHNSVTATAV